MKTSVLLSCVLIASLSGLVGQHMAAAETPAAVTAGPGANHPRIDRAIADLQVIVTTLQAAPDDFNGHKADAITDCQDAITQLQTALTFVHSSDTDTTAPTLPASKHPLVAAVKDLRIVVAGLKKAPDDFGGHKADAMKACDKALHQLKLALEQHKKKGADGTPPPSTTSSATSGATTP